MNVAITSLETHYALAAAAATRLPVRAIVGQWLRELGAVNGVARFPGPRRSPGNVTTAHVGKVCGHLVGGSATERHNFPVFCTIGEGVKEYAWYFNNLRYYTAIAGSAAGDWRKACNLIERSPWSSDHYGGTLDRTAAVARIGLVRIAGAVVNIRTAPRLGNNVGAQARKGRLFAWVADVAGGKVGGAATWHRVRYGDGRIGYVHSSVADRLPSLP